MYLDAVGKCLAQVTRNAKYPSAVRFRVLKREVLGTRPFALALRAHREGRTTVVTAELLVMLQASPGVNDVH